jgi:hypothetical protein
LDEICKSNLTTVITTTAVLDGDKSALSLIEDRSEIGDDISRGRDVISLAEMGGPRFLEVAVSGYT